MSDQMRSVETKIHLLESEKKSTAKHVMELEEKNDNLERNSVKTSIEIKNIPKFPQETKEMLCNMVQTLAQYLNFNISKSNLRDVQRSLSKQDKKFSSIIVEFHYTFIMTTLLKEPLIVYLCYTSIYTKLTGQTGSLFQLVEVETYAITIMSESTQSFTE
ncbi:hypothetical protein K1T71_001149 [Dendrolimus kikuchii]|uniref:Uncharacterized protein n=1 Tax=Dendrolimus kikuchii TaxID=765133 RepID=A0ACC1DGU6_9NEOP|nr:hypothetical protein K1T71_001149 [Dendrolimus kikuchii]